MPRYEYHCHDCGHSFERVTTLSDHERDRREPPACPKCQSHDVAITPPSCNVVTSHKA